LKNNQEIDEIEEKMANLTQTNTKLRRENRDLNKEALDLENKI